jgi:hypothetical protein
MDTIKRGAWQGGVIGVLVKELHVVEVVFLHKRLRSRKLRGVGVDPHDVPLRPHAATQRPEDPHGATPQVNTAPSRLHANAVQQRFDFGFPHAGLETQAF